MGAGNQEEVEDITPDLLAITLITITIGEVVQFLALRDLLAETEVKPTLEKNEQGRDSTDKGKDIGFPLGRSNRNGGKPSANQPQHDSPSLSSLQLTHVATVLRDIAVAPFSCNEVNGISLFYRNFNAHSNYRTELERQESRDRPSGTFS